MRSAYINQNISDCGSHAAGKRQRKITVSKAARVGGAIIFFGIPAVTITTAVLGYGIRSLCKRIKQK